MSIKLVEGQLQFWQMVNSLANPKTSFVNQVFDEFVTSVERSQQVAPDLLPATVHVHPMIDSSGKVVDKISAGLSQPGFGSANGRIVDAGS
jgi:hypothetical protein